MLPKELPTSVKHKGIEHARKRAIMLVRTNMQTLLMYSRERDDMCAYGYAVVAKILTKERSCIRAKTKTSLTSDLALAQKAFCESFVQ